MFTVNIKGKRDLKNIEFVKLEMVFYKRGFARVTKVLYLTGLYKDWDPKSQTFSGKESAEKNKLLRQEKQNTSKLLNAGNHEARIGFRWSYLTITKPIQTTETNIFQSLRLSKNLPLNLTTKSDTKMVVYC